MAKSRKIGLKTVKLSQKSLKKAFLKSKFFNFFKILVATCEIVLLLTILLKKRAKLNRFETVK